MGAVDRFLEACAAVGIRAEREGEDTYTHREAVNVWADRTTRYAADTVWFDAAGSVDRTVTWGPNFEYSVHLSRITMTELVAVIVKTMEESNG